MSAQPRVIYLGGFGRSGSTLLERILGQIPGWTNVGELVDLPRSVFVHQENCGCGEPFLSCPMWSKVGEAAFGGWHEDEMKRLADLRFAVARQRQLGGLIALARGRGSDQLRADVQAYQAGYGAIYRAVAEVTGAQVIVDASKGPAHGLALALTAGVDPGYDMSMVNLVRDPRGVAYSWSRRQTSRPQASGEAGAEMWRISAERSALQWAALQSEMSLMARAAGVEMVRMRYEDLVERPLPSLRRLLDQLQLPDADLSHITDDVVRLDASHGLSGNPGRFTSGEITLSGDHAWRTALPARDRYFVTAATLPWLAAYGYPVSPGPVGQQEQQGPRQQNGQKASATEQSPSTTEDRA